MSWIRSGTTSVAVTCARATCGMLFCIIFQSSFHKRVDTRHRPRREREEGIVTGDPYEPRC